MTVNGLLRSVLETFDAQGWRNRDGAAAAVVRALEATTDMTRLESAIGRALPADWLVVNSVSRRSAGGILARALANRRSLVPQMPAVPMPSAEIVIITALPLERHAVERHFILTTQVAGPLGTIYTKGCIGAPNGPTAVTVQTGQGNTTAGVETERALSLFHPKVLLFVGVAGALKSQQLGTVIAAEFVYDYSHLSEEHDGLKSRAKTHESSYGALQTAHAVARSGEWRRRRKRPLGGWPSSTTPDAVVKPIAAGPRLVKAAGGPTAAWLSRIANDAVAVEMEGWGVLEAAFAHRGVESLVVLGLSDHLSDKGEASDLEWQPAAAANAAAFAIDVALRLLHR